MTANTPTSHPNLTLSPVEQSGPRGYIRPLFFFSLERQAVKDEVMGMLQEGLRLTEEAVPMLTAELVADTDSAQKGRFHLRQGGKSGKLFEKDLRGITCLTYDQLREQNFPSSSLPEELFCPVPCFPTPGSPTAVFHAQATMIEGGLVLNICIMHLCADARAIYEILDIWSRNCLHFQDPAKYAACNTIPEAQFAKEPFVQSSPSERGNAENHPEFVVFDKPPAPPPAMFKKTFRTKVFYFSTDKLVQLKQDASANLKDGAWVSTHDAICALIWRCVLAAQVNLKAISNDTRSLNTICVDGRLRASPNLAEDHIGCPMVYATPSIDVESTLASEDVSAVALAIRRAVDATDAQYVNSLVTWFNKIPSFDCLGVRSFGGLMDTSVMTSSWSKVPFYKLSWGSILGDQCESVRTVWEGFFNWSQVILPELPVERDGGMEVVVGLDENDWSRFKQGKLWYRYAVSR